MYDFKLFVENKDLMEMDEPAPPGVDPEMWATANERMRNYLRTQAQGGVPQAPQGIPSQPVTYKVSQARAARALGPVQGQTGQGLESIAAGGRVPPHLVPQIPSGDIAPGWDTATKFFKGRDGQVYKK